MYQSVQIACVISKMMNNRQQVTLHCLTICFSYLQCAIQIHRVFVRLSVRARIVLSNISRMLRQIPF